VQVLEFLPPPLRPFVPPSCLFISVSLCTRECVQIQFLSTLDVDIVPKSLATEYDEIAGNGVFMELKDVLTSVKEDMHHKILAVS